MTRPNSSTDSTPRITPGTWRETSPLIAGLSELIGRSTGTESPALFRTLGRHRKLFWGWLKFAGRLMPGGTLPRRETELVILRVAMLTKCDYELNLHERIGADAGITSEEIQRVAVGPEAEGWTDRERILLTVTDELHHDRDVSDTTWTQLRGHLDEPACLELLFLVGHYEMLATTLITLRLRPDRDR